MRNEKKSMWRVTSCAWSKFVTCRQHTWRWFSDSSHFINVFPDDFALFYLILFLFIFLFLCYSILVLYSSAYECMRADTERERQSKTLKKTKEAVPVHVKILWEKERVVMEVKALHPPKLNISLWKSYTHNKWVLFINLFFAIFIYI